MLMIFLHPKVFPEIITITKILTDFTHMNNLKILLKRRIMIIIMMVRLKVTGKNQMKNFIENLMNLMKDFIYEIKNLMEDFICEIKNLMEDFICEIKNLMEDFICEIKNLMEDFICEIKNLMEDFI